MTAGKHGTGVAGYEGVGLESDRAVERTAGKARLLGPAMDISETQRKLAGAGNRAEGAAPVTPGQLAQAPAGPGQRFFDRLRNRQGPPQPNQPGTDPRQPRETFLDKLGRRLQNPNDEPRPLVDAAKRLLEGAANSEPTADPNSEQGRQQQNMRDAARLIIGLRPLEILKETFPAPGSQVAEEISLAQPLKLGEASINLELLGPLKKEEINAVKQMLEGAIDAPASGLFTFRDVANKSGRVADVQTAGVIARTGEALLLGLVHPDKTVHYLLVGKNGRAELVDQVGKALDRKALRDPNILTGPSVSQPKIASALEYGCLVAPNVPLDRGILVIPPGFSKVEAQRGEGQSVQVKLEKPDGSSQTRQLSGKGWSTVP